LCGPRPPTRSWTRSPHIVSEFQAQDTRICALARVSYERKDHAGHRFWVARYGRYAVRIDATRRGV
jgi:hypothetical protein